MSMLIKSLEGGDENKIFHLKLFYICYNHKKYLWKYKYAGIQTHRKNQRIDKI